MFENMSGVHLYFTSLVEVNFTDKGYKVMKSFAILLSYFVWPSRFNKQGGNAKFKHIIAQLVQVQAKNGWRQRNGAGWEHKALLELLY